MKISILGENLADDFRIDVYEKVAPSQELWRSRVIDRSDIASKRSFIRSSYDFSRFGWFELVFRSGQQEIARRTICLVKVLMGVELPELEFERSDGKRARVYFEVQAGGAEVAAPARWVFTLSGVLGLTGNYPREKELQAKAKEKEKEKQATNPGEKVSKESKQAEEKKPVADPTKANLFVRVLTQKGEAVYRSETLPISDSEPFHLDGVALENLQHR